MMLLTDYSTCREQPFRYSDPPVRVSEQSPLIKDKRPSVVPYGILDKEARSDFQQSRG